MQKRYAILLGAATLAAACSTPKKVEEPVVQKAEPKVEVPEPAIYRAANKRMNDIIHTQLDVSFDYAKQYLFGKATITVKPYFNPSFYLDLNAVGFDLKEVSVVNSDGTKSPLTYTYDGKVITIKLDKVYTREEEFKVFIDYVAKPNEIKTKGSAAITNDKGLYFINPSGRDRDKPTQIWTQGETQSNSCWFPTIDAPNERMTQEITITAENKYVTLSNGVMVSTRNNGNGTHTDVWRQNVPAAPYLTMMAIGNFAVVKDKPYKGKEVSYYVEPEFEKDAKAIFGNTPEMIAFFSSKLGYDFPWEKYAQVVVRDYVSGAMENSSAVVHGEFLQRTTRELQDNTNEDVVAHELFHHWFGDLVTCESWSNLPLNESFATYGEYLWNEYKYGQDEADYGLQADLGVYLQQAQQKNANLIRFDYEDKEDMFDGISYQKGGRILHMLRKYLGDEAFFAGLKTYLNQNQFKPVEAHQLRLVFEEISGEDLNWFFNQWFYNHGNPDLDIKTAYDEATQKVTVNIEQKQDFTKNPLFKLPISIDVYVNGKPTKYGVTINKAKEQFVFDAAAKPDFVNVDADKSLLCTKKETKSPIEWANMYHMAPLYLDKYEAITNLAKVADQNGNAAEVVIEALSDKFWNIRAAAIKNISKASANNKEMVMNKLVEIANNDPKSSVRAAAIKALAKNYDEPTLVDLYRAKSSEQSYLVQGEALEALGKKQPAEALMMAKLYESEKNGDLIRSVSNLYLEKGSDAQNSFFIGQLQRLNGGQLYVMLQSYGKFLGRCSDETITRSLLTLEDIARKNSTWFVRLGAVQALDQVTKKYEDKATEAEGKLEGLKKQQPKPAEQITASETSLADINRRKEAVSSLVKSIKADERDPQLMKIYGTLPQESEKKEDKKAGSK